jgi:hypothetical protein
MESIDSSIVAVGGTETEFDAPARSSPDHDLREGY